MVPKQVLVRALCSARGMLREPSLARPPESRSGCVDLKFLHDVGAFTGSPFLSLYDTLSKRDQYLFAPIARGLSKGKP